MRVLAAVSVYTRVVHFPGTLVLPVALIAVSVSFTWVLITSTVTATIVWHFLTAHFAYRGTFVLVIRVSFRWRVGGRGGLGVCFVITVMVIIRPGGWGFGGHWWRCNLASWWLARPLTGWRSGGCVGSAISAGHTGKRNANDLCSIFNRSRVYLQARLTHSGVTRQDGPG